MFIKTWVYTFFQELKAENYPIPAETYASMIHLYSRLNKIDEAKNCLEEFQKVKSDHKLKDYILLNYANALIKNNELEGNHMLIIAISELHL